MDPLLNSLLHLRGHVELVVLAESQLGHRAVGRKGLGGHRARHLVADDPKPLERGALSQLDRQLAAEGAASEPDGVQVLHLTNRARDGPIQVGQLVETAMVKPRALFEEFLWERSLDVHRRHVELCEQIAKPHERRQQLVQPASVWPVAALEGELGHSAAGRREGLDEPVKVGGERCGGRAAHKRAYEARRDAAQHALAQRALVPRHLRLEELELPRERVGGVAAAALDREQRHQRHLQLKNVPSSSAAQIEQEVAVAAGGARGKLLHQPVLDQDDLDRLERGDGSERAEHPLDARAADGHARQVG
mmetsp:Transcript_1000/g.2048  ORF Transcript_1000/g.2048 Transcript_1000/m.2048 type:complete len:306 (+) Transcript_1000:206-1123(+)|eukprot:5624587-Pleurochrysis_carterae.AAC.9